MGKGIDVWPHIERMLFYKAGREISRPVLMCQFLPYSFSMFSMMIFNAGRRFRMSL